MDIDGLVSKLVGRDWIDSEIVLLLGAGCSRTSGIPGVSDLARQWLIEARQHDPTVLPGVSEDNAAEYYYEICGTRWPTPEQIKSEIGRFSNSATPGIGYVMLAKLMAARAGHGNIRTILTTNFDNLIEQAFLLFTTERPIVIPDPKLIGSFGGTKKAVQIVKLHGDSRYDPKNTKEVTKKIDRNVASRIKQRFSGGILLVLGYGGNDVGLGEAISEWLHKGTFQQVLWVDTTPPGDAVGGPAKQRKVDARIEHIPYADFDEFMIKFGESIDKHHASSASTDIHIYRYHEKMMWLLGLYGDTGRQAFSFSPDHFDDYFKYFVSAANDVRANRLGKAKKTLKDGLNKNTGNTNYKIFLASVCKSIFGDRKEYGRLCQEAIAAAPDHAAANSELAIFYKENGDRERALTHFRVARNLCPSDWNNRLNYCGYLLTSTSSEDRTNGEAEYHECEMHVYEPRHRLELAFYAYAHELRHPSPLRDIHRYLQTERSPNYDLKVNIACAPHQKHSLLEKVAAAMANNTIDARPVLDELDKLIKAGAS